VFPGRESKATFYPHIAGFYTAGQAFIARALLALFPRSAPG
jgi:hypothetical protein